MRASGTAHRALDLIVQISSRRTAGPLKELVATTATRQNLILRERISAG
ncbi:hypothetical protein ACIRBY_15805 [Streptomyces sp. NPDC096136]